MASPANPGENAEGWTHIAAHRYCLIDRTTALLTGTAHITTKIQSTESCITACQKQLLSSGISKLAGKKTVASYLI